MFKTMMTLMLFVATVASAEENKPQGSAEITVNISKFKNTDGQIGCVLFNSSKGFPDDKTQSFTKVGVPITGENGQCQFKNLPAGTYAVSVLHDANKNGKMEKNFLGMPKEGYGVSNNKTYSTKQPKWEESKFDLAEGEKKVLEVTLRY